MVVYLPWHARDLDEETDVKLIGVYSTAKKAEETRERMRSLPGFCDFPDGFEISNYEVDRDSWTTGFVTIPYGEV